METLFPEDKELTGLRPECLSKVSTIGVAGAYLPASVYFGDKHTRITWFLRADCFIKYSVFPCVYSSLLPGLSLSFRDWKKYILLMICNLI